MAGQQYDPEVIAFLKLRNAPLTHSNYNSVLQQMQANPSMRGAPVADPSPSDKTYDGGLDELNLGGDVPKAGPRPGAGAPPVPQSKPPVPDDQQQHGASGSFGDSPAPQVAEDGAGGGGGAGPAAAVLGGGTLAGILAYLRGQSNGAGGASPRVEPSGPASPGPVRGLPATAVPVPDGNIPGEQDLLAGHAPPAALPAPAEFTGQNPELSGKIQKLLPLMGDSGNPENALAIADQGAHSPDPMVMPGAAPSSPVVPMPDNAPNGMIEQFADRINKLSQAGRGPEAAQMIERLLGLVGHAHR